MNEHPTWSTDMVREQAIQEDDRGALQTRTGLYRVFT